MRSIVKRSAALAAVAVALGSGPRAEVFAKTYAFKPNTALQVGTELTAGLRLDTVEFLLAAGPEESTFGGPKVKVTISNVGKQSVTVGIAVAVMNADGRLVGVASGGTKVFPLRAERQMVYTLDFGGVSSALATGTVFHIAIEPKG